jgi:O-antigen/teichoic acid export membrane protein
VPRRRAAPRPLSAAAASLAAAASHGTRMVANLAVVKAIAVLLGPAGLGVLGHLMSVATMVSLFAGGGTGTGITKYVAEFARRPVRLVRFLGAASWYGFAFSALVVVATVLFASPIARALLGDPALAWLVPLIGLSQFLAFAGTAVGSVANGLGRTDVFARLTIVGYALAIVPALLLVRAYGIAGAGVAVLLVAGAHGIPALVTAYRSPLRPLVRPAIARDDLGRLARFTLMSLASAACFPIAEITIRGAILRTLGETDAGLWQALSRLSGAYLGFFTVFLATHYMPRLSALGDAAAQVREVRRHLGLMAGVFTGFAAVLLWQRDLAIGLLFSAEFAPMGRLMPRQVVGDLLRLSAYVIGFLGVARGSAPLYVAAEVLQSGLYTALGLIALRIAPSIEGTVNAYVLTYATYFAIAVAGLLVFRRRHA